MFPNYNGPEDITDQILKEQVTNELANVVSFVHTKVSASTDVNTIIKHNEFSGSSTTDSSLEIRSE